MSTRLVSDAEYDALIAAINALVIDMEQLKDQPYPYVAGFLETAVQWQQGKINRLRESVGAWLSVRPLEDYELGRSKELLEADFIGDCSTHGLFFCERGERWRRAVNESDCPVCLHEQDVKELDAMRDRRMERAADERTERDPLAGRPVRAGDGDRRPVLPAGVVKPKADYADERSGT